METRYREYIGEIPINTVKEWQSAVMNSTKWQPSGWSGDPKEPFRHWTSYASDAEVYSAIWNCINESFKEDGFRLKVDRIISNLYNHGDSSWLHIDNENPSAWTAIIYLNDFWDLNWGGETVIVENNEILKCFAPTPGKFILFKSNLLHGPRPVSREAPYSRLGVTFQCLNNI